MKILIADDDPVSLLFLQDALEDWGYDVAAVSDGRTACSVLQAGEGPMMAVLDWMMPGMDGLDICRAVRDTVHDRYVYIVMLTSRSDTAHIVEAMNAGADCRCACAPAGASASWSASCASRPPAMR